MNDTRAVIADCVVHFIASYWLHYGYAPSIRDVCEGCGLPSTSIVAYHLRRLEQAGRVEREPGLARTLRVRES